VPAELAGVVRDTAGNPLRDAEIMLPALGRATRSGADGKFFIGGVAPGFHEVWLRHIGNISVPFDWHVEEGKRVEISVTLRPLPNTLDPVRIWANEGKSLASTSMVSGRLVDSSGAPIPDADLQLIGASRSTRSGADGSFEFRHVPPGAMTLRARRLGYTPSTLMIELRDDDQRAVTMRLSRLAESLDAVVVEASGYGKTDVAWHEFDVRERWRNSAGGDAFALGPKRLAEAGGMPLDWLLRGYMGGAHGPPLMACVLENGITPRYVPISIYAANEVDRIEYYPAGPPEREYTGTVQARMRIYPQCGKNDHGGHAPYYVLWLKNAR
jgi:hypothetical protein